MIDLWLKHVRQEGLVVSQSALDEENLAPIKQTLTTPTCLKKTHPISGRWQLMFLIGHKAEYCVVRTCPLRPLAG